MTVPTYSNRAPLSGPTFSAIRALAGRVAIARHTLRALASISVWQLATYLLPLITLPYLARTIGVEGFGVIGLAAAIAGYAALLVDWGFGMTATQAVARHRNDPSQVREIVWNTILAKLGLAVVAAVAVLGLSSVLVDDPLLRTVISVFTAGLFANALTVDWALRGMERHGSFAFSAIVGQLTYVPLVFLLVHSPGDVAWAAAASVGAAAIAATASWARARQLGLLGWPCWSIRGAFAQLTSGIHVFLSEAAIPLYTGSGMLLLGALSSTQQAGFYAGADKLRGALQRALAPTSMVFYPRISHQAAHDPQRMQRTFFKVLAAQATIGLMLSAALCAAAGPLVHLLLGSQFDQSIPVARILAGVIFLVALSDAFGRLGLLPLGLKRLYAFTVLGGAFLGILLMAPFVYMWGALGAASALLIAEFAVTLAGLVILIRHVPWFVPGLRAAIGGLVRPDHSHKAPQPAVRSRDA